VLYYPAALTPRSQAVLEELVGRDKLIVASEDDAHHLAVNSVSIGDDLVFCHASAGLRADLVARGYRVHVVPLDSFNRSGGAAYCLTLRLDNSSCSDVLRSGDAREALIGMRAAA